MKQLSEGNIIFEGIVSVSALIKAAGSGTARRRIVRVLIEESRFRSERHKVAFLRSAASKLGFEIEKITGEDVDSIAEGKTHGGIFAEVTPAVYPGVEALDPSSSSFSVILDGTEDPYSLGHSARVLYCSGADALIIPRLPDMADKVICRASAGAFELMRVFVCDPAEAVKKYKEAGIKTACMGIRDSVAIRDADLKYPLLLVCGGEKRGISASVSGNTDLTVRIPYAREFLGSLPSETALSIFAYEIMSQNSVEGIK